MTGSVCLARCLVTKTPYSVLRYRAGKTRKLRQFVSQVPSMQAVACVSSARSTKLRYLYRCILLLEKSILMTAFALTLEIDGDNHILISIACMRTVRTRIVPGQSNVSSSLHHAKGTERDSLSSRRYDRHSRAALSQDTFKVSIDKLKISPNTSYSFCY